MLLKKSDSANLENKRAIFLEIGLVITLIIVLSAFNWKSYEKQFIPNYHRVLDDIPLDMVPVTEHKRPEPPKINIPPVITTINIVDDAVTVDDDFIFSSEIDVLDSVAPYVPVQSMEEEESSPEEEIFTVVESMPMFPGGEKALRSYLHEKMRYPEMAKEAGISGKVYITFVVEKDGSITDVKVLRGIGGGCDEEALRVIKAMPTWTPGKQRNIPVRVHFILDIKFTLNQK